MKTSTNRRTFVAVSNSSPTARASPMAATSGRAREFLPSRSGLVEEVASLAHLRPLRGGKLDVRRREQEDLVGHTLHATVQGVREAAREVDQPLRQLLIGALEVEDDRNRALELVGNLLRVVEAARHDEVELARCRLGGGRVVNLARAARCEPAHVRALARVVAPLQLLVRGEPVLVPVLFLLGDAEVDEGAIPDVREAHAYPNGTPAPDRGRAGRAVRLPRRRRASPGSRPSRARG